MARCSQGHEVGTADDCGECGRQTVGPAGSAPTSTVPAPEALPTAERTSCPRCGGLRTGRFCEECGYDFVADSLNPAAPDSAPRLEPASRVLEVADDSAPAPPTNWLVVVNADRTYFDIVREMDGVDAATITFPRFVAERRFFLAGERLVIGRRSRTRGIYPDIDLTGPQEDPGVSHLHAMLIAGADSTWGVVDLGSVNGTYLNQPSSGRIEPYVPRPIGDGDTIYLGAWTVLAISAQR